MSEARSSSPPGQAAEAFFMLRAEAREMVLSLRALFLVLVYFVTAGGVGWALIQLDEKTDGQLSTLADRVGQLGDTEKTAAIDELTKMGLPEAVVSALLNGELPLLLLIVLFSSTFVVPGLILLVGFNRISGDVSTGFTRYVLQRVHRGSYLFGKVAGHWLVSFLAVVLVHLMLLALGKVYEVFEIDQVLAAAPRIWLAMALFTLTYVAYTQLMSALVSQPFLSLLFGIMGIFAVKLATWILSFFYPPLGKVWIGDWDLQLWALDPAAIAVFLGYAAVFVGLAYVTIRRRDL